MTLIARPLAAALASLALAASTAVADPGKTPVPGAPGAPGVSAPGKTAPDQTPNRPAKAPPGYVRVVAVFTSATDVQTRGSVACPAGTVVFGGGVFVSSSNINININSSFPAGNGWVADVDNVSGGSVGFTVHAVCATQPKKYTIVASPLFTSPAESQAIGTVACPARTVVLGGGSLSSSGSVAVNINSTLPEGNGWRVDQNTNTNFGTGFTVFAICGKKPRGYTVSSSAPVANPAGNQTRAAVNCPAGQVPLSGGGRSNSSSPAVDLNTSAPLPSGWEVFEDNTSGFGDAAITALVICAGV